MFDRIIDHPLYQTWQGMIRRCADSSASGYQYYGGRGITVCQVWSDDFWAFVTDMGDKPGPEYSIDRIDNNGPYSPENCRWATPEQQNNNKSDNRLITYQGQTQTLMQWAKQTGLSYHMLNKRILKYGWPIEKVFTAPKHTKSHPNERLIIFEGQTQNLSQWARQIGISARSLAQRLDNWPLDKALTLPPGSKFAKRKAPKKSGPQPKMGRQITHQGKTQNIAAWARETGIYYLTISRRLKAGWSVEKTLTTPARETGRAEEGRHV